MKAKTITAFILLALFGLSAIIRLPLLNRPLSKHHEFCTAIALRILKCWEQEGIKNLRFKPATNYQGEANKFINNYASGSGSIKDLKGNYYYLSHPPLAYYLAYSFFTISQIKVAVLPLQIFNLLLHFVSALGIFLIINTLYKKPINEFNIPAIVGFTVYLFNPATLWFQSNVYMSDMVVQLPFIYAVFICAKMMMYERHLIKNSLLLLIVCFAMVYTSWLGIFFCLSALILMLRSKLLLSLTLVEVLLTALALGLGLTFLQYAKIAGIANFKTEMLCRFNDRSSFHGMTYFLLSFYAIIKNYFFNYAALYFMLAVALLLVYKVRKKIRLNSIFSSIMVVSIVPILLLHLFLSNYSGHDFTVLYAAVPFSLFAGFLTERIYTRVKPLYLFLFVAVFIAINVAQFYYTNRPGKLSQSGEPYDIYMKEGNFIKQQASAAEIVFALDYKPSPETIWYAQRNIKQVSHVEEAYAFLKFRKIKHGIVFQKNDASKISAYKIELSK
jgi:hypothetical protein